MKNWASVTLIFDLAMVSVSRLYKGRLSSTVAPVSGEQFQQSKSRRKDVVVWGFFFFFLSVVVLFGTLHLCLLILLVLLLCVW